MGAQSHGQACTGTCLRHAVRAVGHHESVHADACERTHLPELPLPAAWPLSLPSWLPSSPPPACALCMRAGVCLCVCQARPSSRRSRQAAPHCRRRPLQEAACLGARMPRCLWCMRAPQGMRGDARRHACEHTHLILRGGSRSLLLLLAHPCCLQVYVCEGQG